MVRCRAAFAGAAMALAATPAAAVAANKVVYAGGPAKFQQTLGSKYGATLDNFLVNRVAIHVGDTVTWNGASLAGGFHTVDIPKLNGQDLALVTATGKSVNGVNDAAGNPFWFNGKLPVVAFNTVLFGASGPTGNYNGTTRVDSGLPVGPGPHTFKVRFRTPGTYKYFCDVHPGMVGYVVVKPKGQKIPGVRADAAQLRVAEKQFIASAKKTDRTKVTGANVHLGAVGRNGLEVLAMFPAKLNVKTGTTVTFSMPARSRELHTASFGPAKYLGALAGSFNAPAPAPAAIYPSDPPGTITLTPSSHGNGFASVGALDQDSGTPTIPATGKITFTQPGTYHFICLIHTFMQGTIVVK